MWSTCTSSPGQTSCTPSSARFGGSSCDNSWPRRTTWTKTRLVRAVVPRPSKHLPSGRPGSIPTWQPCATIRHCRNTSWLRMRPRFEPRWQRTLPDGRTSEPRPRARDLNRNCRLTGKPLVRNPMWIESQCIVCWAGGKRPRGGGGMTAKYCEECSWDTTWNKKSRSGGYTYDHQPRLCSEACWTKFHTERISGLDFNKRRSRNASGRAGRR